MQKIFLVTYLYFLKKKKRQQRPFGIIGSLTAEALQFVLKKKKIKISVFLSGKIKIFWLFTAYPCLLAWNLTLACRWGLIEKCFLWGFFVQHSWGSSILIKPVKWVFSRGTKAIYFQRLTHQEKKSVMHGNCSVSVVSKNLRFMLIDSNP